MQSSTTLCIVDALCDIMVHAANVTDDLVGSTDARRCSAVVADVVTRTMDMQMLDPGSGSVPWMCSGTGTLTTPGGVA